MPPNSRCLAQELGVDPADAPESTSWQALISTLSQRLYFWNRSATLRHLYEYKPSGLQPQLLQFANLSSRSVIFCYSYCACSCSQYSIQHTHCFIHHLWHITTPYREKRTIYYVNCILLLWWVPENGTSVSKHVAVYIYIYIYCKWCITDCIFWMIYWLFFNLALFHCTIKVATHIYRSTAVHDVSITQSFCAFNCAVFSSSVYVCYMCDWVMWRVYWLCWIEAWQMWISIY